MKKLFFTLLLMASVVFAHGQSTTIDDYRNTYRPDNQLFFYKSTLRMYARVAVNLAENPEDLPDLVPLIEGIEKIKYFNYYRSADQNETLKTLKKGVMEENYESVMSANYQGNALEILMIEKRGNPVGFVAFITGDEGMQIMDIEGVPDLNKLMSFVQYVSTNSGDFSLLNAFR